MKLKFKNQDFQEAATGGGLQETSFSDGTKVTVDFDCGRMSVFKKGKE